MGHLGHLKEEYRALVQRLEGGPIALPEPTDPAAWQGWKEILEILYTPEDAALAARLPVAPTDLAGVARRVGMTPEELHPKLERLCERGVVMDLVNPRTGEARYLLAPPVVGFFEFSMMRAKDHVPKKRMAEALEAYVHGDEAFVREVFGGDTVIGRALVHESALEDDAPDILDWERATSILADARLRAVSLCYCRHKAEHLEKACDAPMEVCLSLGAGADFVIRRGFGRAIEKTEAMEILAAARAKGLVQIADNVANRPTYICNCCGCCCAQLQAINLYDIRGVNPSPVFARSDLAACSGCSRCARACPIAAIAMKPCRLEAQRRCDLEPVVDESRCIGCGVCADACKKDAMKMRPRAERPHVPASPIERSLRMAIERGHLSQLLFDQGAGGRTRFLGRAVRALAKLPLAERILASEQVTSRFVKVALARVKDPTR